MQLPYFDKIFDQIESSDQDDLGKNGLDVHWGFWHDDDLETADISMTGAKAARNNMNMEIFKQANLTDGQDILDVGCGFGGAVSILNETYNNLNLNGLNIDPRQIEYARNNIIAKAQNSVDFIEGDACDLPFEDESFDNLFAIECIFHFPSRKDFFNEACRVLKPKGRLVFSDFISTAPRLPALIPLYIWYATALKNVYGSSGEARMPTPRFYKKLARRSSFKLINIRDISKNTLPTYNHLKKYGKILGAWEKDWQRANRCLELCANLRLSKYCFFSLQKI